MKITIYLIEKENDNDNKNDTRRYDKIGLLQELPKMVESYNTVNKRLQIINNCDNILSIAWKGTKNLSTY
jgi:hypothetical protein